MPFPLSWAYNWEYHPTHLCNENHLNSKRNRGCPACCLGSQHPVTVSRCPVARQRLALCSAGKGLLHPLLGMQAACCKVNSWCTNAEHRSQSVSPPPSSQAPPLLHSFFPASQTQNGVSGSKNNLSKMAECSRECQAMKRRERAPPAVQWRDSIFLSSLFLNMSEEIDPTASKLILSWILIPMWNSKIRE